MASIAFKTEQVIDAKNQSKDNKYHQKTNENRLIHKFRKAFFACLTEPCPSKSMLLFDQLVEDFARYPVEVKPDRAPVRKSPRKMKFHDRRKSVF